MNLSQEFDARWGLLLFFPDDPRIEPEYRGKTLVVLGRGSSFQINGKELEPGSFTYRFVEYGHLLYPYFK